MARISLLLHEPVVRIVRDALASGFPPRVCNCDTITQAIMFTCSRAPCCRSLVCAFPLEPRSEQSSEGEQFALQEERKFQLQVPYTIVNAISMGFDFTLIHPVFSGERLM